jgi:hypothetical protein
MFRIHIKASTQPLKTVKRRIGATNVGFYCSACGEFIALAVEPEDSASTIEITADLPIRIRCPYCRHKEYRHVGNARRVLLTEASMRRGSGPL